jgi:polar amino acid transport system permease protein
VVIFDFSSVFAAWQLFLSGLEMTVFLTVASCSLGTALGILAAWGRVYGNPYRRALISCYVEVMRNTPFLVQIFFIYFGLAGIGLKMGDVVASVVALTINLGAYMCEIVRSGIEATPKGQVEAAKSLALSNRQVFMRVILPQALARVWPGLTSQLVIIMLASAVCSQISTSEISYVANFISSKTFRSFESYIVVTIMYMLLTIILREVLEWLGPRFIFGQETRIFR